MTRWPSNAVNPLILTGGVATLTKLPAPLEHHEQTLFFQWLDYVFVSGNGLVREPLRAHVYAVPNAGKRSYQTADEMRAEGMTAGTPDISVDVPSGKFHGLRLEMKRLGAKPPTKAQVEQMENRRRMGYEALLVQGFSAARQATVRYLSNSWVVMDRWSP